MHRSLWRSAAIAVAGVILLAACTTGAPASQAPSAAANSKSFWIGFTSVGLSSAPFLAAIKNLNTNKGYDIKTPILAQSELVTAGVAEGQFAFGSGANNSVLAAVAKGANLKVLVDRVANEWTLYAATDITTCEGLGGRTLALHSAGAVSTAMVHNYLQTKCPGTQPTEQFIEGSPNRVAALLADQIDASPLELGDSVTIEAQAGDRYHLLSSFSADLPDLKTTSIYVNGDFAAQNPQSVRDVVQAVIEEFRAVGSDAAALKAAAEADTNVKAAINPATIDAATQKYVELGMFDPNGGVTEENLNYTAKFFNDAKAVDTLVPLEDWTDLSFLNAVLSDLGRK